jgi:hypothetical protein
MEQKWMNGLVAGGANLRGPIILQSIDPPIRGFHNFAAVFSME